MTTNTLSKFPESQLSGTNPPNSSEIYQKLEKELNGIKFSEETQAKYSQILELVLSKYKNKLPNSLNRETLRLAVISQLKSLIIKLCVHLSLFYLFQAFHSNLKLRNKYENSGNLYISCFFNTISAVYGKKSFEIRKTVSPKFLIFLLDNQGMDCIFRSILLLTSCESFAAEKQGF